MGDRLRVRRATTGDVVAEYTLGLGIAALGADADTVVAADSSGAIHVLTLVGAR